MSNSKLFFDLICLLLPKEKNLLKITELNLRVSPLCEGGEKGEVNN